MSNPKQLPFGALPLPPNGDIPRRQEITALAGTTMGSLQIELYIEALRVLMTGDCDDEMSYFRLAGIHGAPYTDWNGIASPGENPQTNGGFCVHNEITFGTWHRPYMLLYESALYRIIEKIVQAMPPGIRKDQYIVAWTYWRLPYWNWAIPQPYINKLGVPQLFTQQMYQGKPSPFWFFQNPRKDSSGKPAKMGDKSIMGRYAIDSKQMHLDFNFDPCRATSRHGTVSTDDMSAWVNGGNNWTGANDEIQTSQPPGATNASDYVYRLFAYHYDVYGHWVSTVHNPKTPTPGRTDPYLSLEQIHNYLHNWTGGDAASNSAGHMEDVGMSALDPIFWMHHGYIEYLLAAFQKFNPNTWFNDLEAGDPSPDSALDPFYQVKDTKYTSNSVRYWQKLGYDFNIVQPSKPTEPDAQIPDFDRAEFAKMLNGEYATGRKLAHKVNNSYNGELGGIGKDYVINVIYNRLALDKSYTILFFIGLDSGVETQNLKKHPSYVGSIATLSSGARVAHGTCGNCARQAASGYLSRAQVVVTDHLLSRAADRSFDGLSDLLGENVGVYLKEHLSWKVFKADGQEVPLESEELKDLKIFALHGNVTHYFDDDSKLSEYGDYKILWEPTVGKLRGAQPDTDSGLWQESE